MFGSLSGLFGKNFVIGYLLPAGLITFVVALHCDLFYGTHFYRWTADFFASPNEKLPAGRLAFALTAIFVAALLLKAFNPALLNLAQGYFPKPIRNRLSWWQRRHFNDLKTKIDGSTDINEKSRLMVKLMENFPELERLVLPTRFGNIMRASERYPQIVYFIEATLGWTRLEPLVPQVHRDLLEEAKSQVDAFVALWFGGLLAAGLEIAGMIKMRDVGLFYLPLLSLMFSVLMVRYAGSAAGRYGHLVRGAFDLYRADLCAKLGLEMPATLEDERKLWQAVSWTFVYPDPRVADSMSPFRKKARTAPDPSDTV